MLANVSFTGNKTGDFLLDVVPMVGMFLCAIGFVFRAPSRMRKSMAEGNPYATERKIRWVRRGGIFLLVFLPLAISYMTYLYFTGGY